MWHAFSVDQPLIHTVHVALILPHNQYVQYIDLYPRRGGGKTENLQIISLPPNHVDLQFAKDN